MKKKVFYLSCLLLTTLLLFSCKKGGIKIKVDNFSNGKAGEVILVIDKKYASDDVRNYIEEILTQPQPAFNQIEPMFDLLHFENKDFTAYFQRHRSIVQFDINPNFSSNTFRIEENVWARPQVHIHLRGYSMDSLLIFFKQHENEIIDALYDNDLKRVQYFASGRNDAYIEQRIVDKFGIHITVPNTYSIAREEEDFIWLLFRTVRNDRFIIIYKTPGTDLSRRGLIDARNEKTKAYIPGAVFGAYPIVAEVYQFPLYRDNVKIGAITGTELRGLWESVNDKMGGPFYEFSFIDRAGENVISVGGFVYAPEEEKRNYLREVEAIVKSVR
ncbi:MAG: DUF4837 family protein [Bacteroidetes bacterium]|nr:DUF4837 family protein [Bacteroidota bacterium]MCL2302813.1 DUF4837 family protein [Lentimicrobiaceae bacterium]